MLWLAGVVPLVLAVLLSCFIPNSPEHTGQENTSSESVAAAILGPKLRTSTLVLWTATFLVFVVSYTLKSWLPTLFEDFGMSRSTAGLGLAFFGLGGMGGGLILIAVSAKFGTTRSLVVMSLIGALATTAVAVLPANTAVLLFLICIAGAGITACSVGQTGIAVSIYEMSIRTKASGGRPHVDESDQLWDLRSPVSSSGSPGRRRTSCYCSPSRSSSPPYVG